MSETILETIAAHTRRRVAAEQAELPLAALAHMCELRGPAQGHRFLEALRKPAMSFICEVKKASPSKGVIDPDFPYLEIARDYEKAGADCISCLSEPRWFLGSDQIFQEIRCSVSLPMLRKDFTIEEYQLYQAKAIGADGVLLICALLDTRTIARYLERCGMLGLTALVEAHNAEEVGSAVSAGAEIIGVNNRNLKDFTVDFANAARLRDLIPAEVVYVAESGVTSPGGRRLTAGHWRRRSSDWRGADAFSGQRIHACGHEGGGEMTKIKICGLYRPCDIQFVNDARPDWCGFIIGFPKSHRNMSPHEVRSLRACLAPGIIPVGVFVDQPVEQVCALLNDGTISIAQLHGHEDAAYIAALRASSPGHAVWKAFKIRSLDDLDAANASSADLVLLDNGYGTGRTFDWSLAGGVNRPFLLAGGLAPDNIPEAVAALHPYGVDISSGVEIGGQKDRGKILAAVSAARRNET